MDKTHLHDLVDESGKIGALERLLQARHLVQNTPHRPDIAPVIVGFAFAL